MLVLIYVNSNLFAQTKLTYNQKVAWTSNIGTFKMMIDKKVYTFNITPNTLNINGQRFEIVSGFFQDFTEDNQTYIYFKIMMADGSESLVMVLYEHRTVYSIIIIFTKSKIELQYEPYLEASKTL